ncbi:hypothetical protein GCM10009836_41650 [Pseudonocardia ailaonensis]|uniref:Uncharacterized protein n=1 Tax=Pseudonocardia ailaonensis TaxID=367279 RepID=A0ABN2N845_9PSEU
MAEVREQGERSGEQRADAPEHGAEQRDDQRRDEPAAIAPRRVPVCATAVPVTVPRTHASHVTYASSCM